MGLLEASGELKENSYANWFDGLTAPAAARVVTALIRMEQGNLSNVTGVGAGVFESRVNFGPGSRGEVALITLRSGSWK